LSAEPGAGEPEARVTEQPGQLPEERVYRVDASGAEGVLVGDQATQVNYFYRGTWSDGIAPVPLVSRSGAIDSPYRGLRAFGAEDAAFFFGRDNAVAEVLARLSGCLAADGLLVVSGVSGVGKTSLMRAGVLPRLGGAGLGSAPEAMSWPRVALVPGPRPLDELAVRIASAAGVDAGAIRQALRADPAGLALTARQAANAGGSATARVLLVADQFETAFTQCESEEERRAFITALHSAAEAGAALVVLVIRADLEARLADYPELTAAVQDRYLLTGMTERQLRLAITRPAIAAGASVEEDLVEALLRETGAHADVRAGAHPGPQVIGAGVLPLLSHALDQAWRNRAGLAVTLADYERTGGIEGAVASSAQRAYEELTAPQQAAARQVFTRLTATTPDGIDTTVRAARADLLAGKNAEQARDVEATLETFAGERLLTLAAGFVEISHEVLLTAWPMLRDDWLADSRADRAVRTRLQATVTEWARASRDRAYLYTGSRLDAAVRVAARIAADARQIALSPEETEFLGASSHAASRAVRRRRGFTAAIAVLAAGLAVALVIATQTAGRYLTAERSARTAQGTADHERDEAVQSLTEAVSGQLASQSLSAADTDPEKAQQESVIAYALYRTSPEAEYALSTAAANPLAATIPVIGPPASMAFSPDGKTLAIGDATTGDPGVELYDVATGAQIGETLTSSGVPRAVTDDPEVLPVAFSPDGKIVAAAEGSAVIMWNTATQKVTDSYVDGVAGVGAAIDSLAFSPDGTLLATGGDCTGLGASADCGQLQLWNAATGTEVGSALATSRPSDIIGSDPNTLVAFAPDGKTLATATGGVVRLWNVATQRPTGPAFPSLPATVTALTFSPDGGTLVTGDESGAVRLWNVATARQSGASLSAGGAQVNSVAFSPSGSLIAEGDDNGAIRVWDVATRQPVGAALSGGTDSVKAVAFSPDGKTLAGVDGNLTVGLWTVSALAGQQADAPIRAGSGNVGDGTDPLVFGPGGQIFTTDDTGDVTQWNTASGSQDGSFGFTVPASPDGESSPPMALSPDGRTLATGMSDLTGAANDDGTVWLWNVTAAKPAATTIPVPDTVDDGNMSMTGGVQAIAFSPDGREFAVAYFDGNAQVFDTATRQPLGQSLQVVSGNNEVDAMTFGGTGDEDLITLTADGAVNYWNWRRPVPYSQSTSSFTLSLGSQVNAAAFSPDAATLAVGQDNGTVLLWDVAANQQIGPPIQSGNGAVDAVAFSPDGTTLATSDSGGTIRLWNVSYVDPARALAQLCADIGGGIAPLTWALYARNIRYRNACP